jgi:hypothetical protein
MILATTLYDWWADIIQIPGVKTALIMALLSVIEIAPIKISPWSWVGGLIGKLLGIKSVSDKVEALEKKVDENQATTIRVRILRFEDEIQSNKHHSKDSWDQVMDDIRRYEIYTEEHPDFKNNITVASTNHIKKKYDELLEKRAWTVNLTNKE